MPIARRNKTAAFAALLCVCCAVLLPMRVAQAQEPDLSSPEATVRSFFAAFSRGDLTQAVKCLFEVKPDPVIVEMERELREQAKRDKITFAIDEVRAEAGGSGADEVTVSVRGTVTPPQPGTNLSGRLRLRRGGADWKIVPADPQTLMEAIKTPEKNSALLLTSMLAYPGVLVEARKKARETACTSNLKQIALAAMMFAQDYDDKFAFKPATFQKALLPYIKNEAVFRCPEHSKNGAVASPSYVMNSHLAGKAVARLKVPARTVLFFEATAGKMDFRHDGRAGVAFADGHVALVTPEQAKTLRWQP